MITLDDLDRHILLELQGDARVTNQELADRVGLSPSPCLRRVRRLEEAGVIARYTAVLSADVLGLPITAFVRLTLDSHAADIVSHVEERIRAIPEIIEAYLLAGDADYQIKILVPSFPAYEDLLKRELRAIPHLSSIATTFAFAATKSPAPLPIP